MAADTCSHTSFSAPASDFDNRATAVVVLPLLLLGLVFASVTPVLMMQSFARFAA